jgi:MFS transporter, OFA family, oxalate/formate antiporter
MPSTPSEARRWLIAAGGALVMLAIGGVYGWSVFTGPLQEEFDWSSTEALLPYVVLHAVLFVGTFVGGRIQDRVGPRPVALTGITVYSLGVGLSALTSEPGHLWLMIVTYGVLGGLGLGLAYIVPPAVLSKWFPDKRGLANGIAVGGFGAGALITGPVGEPMIEAFGSVPPVLGVLGVGYLVVGVAASLLLRDPPEDDDDEDAQEENEDDFSLGAALRTPQFYLLTAMFTLSVIIGNAFISQASPIAQEVSGVGAGAAAVLVGVIGLFNAGGRPGWAAVSDKLGRLTTFRVMLPISAVAFALMPNAGTIFAVLFVLACVAILNYGGTFGTMPSVSADFYGTTNGGAIYGIMLIAWSLGGVIGPLGISFVHEVTGSFDAALYGFAGLALLGVALTFFTRPPGAEADGGDPARQQDSVGTRDR